MNYLQSFDYAVIIAYMAILVGVGIFLTRKATRSVEDYFIAGRTMPWWALGVSGMTFFFDLAGTTLIISFLFLLGPRGLFIEFRGGVALILPIMMLWTGKWHRRSQCMTGAEWMVFRFGEGFGGQFARIVSAVATIVGTVGMLAYSIKAVSLFFSMFLPFSPLTCAFIILGITTLYTVMSGFYGVVYSNFFQGIVIVVAVVVVVIFAWLQVPSIETLASTAAQVTGNAEWTTTFPQTQTSMPAGYEVYQDLMMFAFFYLLKTVFQGMGWGDDPRYFGAKSDRDCGTLSFLWTSLMTFRWPLMIAMAVLGILLVRDQFPNQEMFAQAAALIKQHLGAVDKSRWSEVLSGLVNSPQFYPPELVGKIQSLLGSSWQSTLQLVSYEGTINPERIMPAVLIFSLPEGMRGLVMVAILAAEMSTFSSNVNRAAGFMTRDLYNRYLRPTAKTRELIMASWGSVLLLVLLGFLFAYSVSSINDIWAWITMGLGSGLLMPAFLRFYWSRFNGGGFAVGTVAGMTVAILQRFLFPGLNELQQFALIGSVGLIGAIIGTYATQPTDPALLERFYRMTRPFGFWKQLKTTLPAAQRIAMEREHRYDLLALPFAIGWQVTMYMLPMQFVIHDYAGFAGTLAVFLACLIALYFLWYRHLPRENAPTLPQEVRHEPEPAAAGTIHSES